MPHDDQPPPNAPPKTWWIEPGRLLAGCYPGDWDAAEAGRKLRHLLQAGARVFVSLIEPDETTHFGPFRPYKPAAEELAREMGVEVRFLNFPIRDMSVPKPARMRAILDAIDAALAEGLCVYVHCWGGHGRTGTVVGCWLRERGLEPEQALERIAHGRRDDPYLDSMRSPQTGRQCEMIYHWQPGGPT